MAHAEGTALRKDESGSDRRPKAINRLRGVQWIRREKTGFCCGWYRTGLHRDHPSSVHGTTTVPPLVIAPETRDGAGPDREPSHLPRSPIAHTAASPFLDADTFLTAAQRAIVAASSPKREFGCGDKSIESRCWRMRPWRVRWDDSKLENEERKGPFESRRGDRSMPQGSLLCHSSVPPQLVLSGAVPRAGHPRHPSPQAAEGRARLHASSPDPPAECE
ncbi:hypothetical protein OIDMADRAFT_141268 [Oidiodendron maius Zn]|uniref:Uncharacterized protein n=1 Tax=Oidiodendron maius (strain Zn) TaxID=913774 RepID=A0A0C3HR63_OIDMZ|nr:hypothetical protein OIDMADRAFT_141268 [Oidiodendron maius Zn]